MVWVQIGIDLEVSSDLLSKELVYVSRALSMTASFSPLPDSRVCADQVPFESKLSLRTALLLQAASM